MTRYIRLFLPRPLFGILPPEIPRRTGRWAGFVWILRPGGMKGLNHPSPPVAWKTQTKRENVADPYQATVEILV